MKLVALLSTLGVLAFASPPCFAASQTGRISFYHEGQMTAFGERFNPNAMTCAHKTLPRGTKVTVSYLGRSVICTINDRGPYRKGRILDVSLAVAQHLAMVDAGVIGGTITW